MSEEIKKEAQDAEINPEDLNQAAGGYTVHDKDAGGDQFKVTEEEAKKLDAYMLRNSGICPRCGNAFADRSEIENHILSWDAGKK